MRHDAGTRTSPRPVSSNQKTSAVETVAGLSKAYSTHSVDPFFGHQSKVVDSSPSLTVRGLRREGDAVILGVRNGAGLATASVSGIHTIICPRPRLAQA